MQVRAFERYIPFIMLTLNNFVFMIFVLSILEWPLKTGFTVVHSQCKVTSGFKYIY